MRLNDIVSSSWKSVVAGAAMLTAVAPALAFEHEKDDFYYNMESVCLANEQKFESDTEFRLNTPIVYLDYRNAEDKPVIESLFGDFSHKGVDGFKVSEYAAKSFDFEWGAPARGTWSAPTEGSPVDHYVARMQIYDDNFGDWGDPELMHPVFIISGLPINETEMVVQMFVGTTIRAAVAGVDAQGRQGPWSDWSNSYTFAAPEEDTELPGQGLPGDTDPVDNTSRFAILRNPGDVMFRIPDQGRLEIYDVRGRCLYSNPRQAVGEVRLEYLLPNAPSGVYALSFVDGNERHLERVTLIK